MSKKFWLKLLVFALAVSMVLSFAACDRGNDGTVTTEKPTEVTTQSPSKETTESKQNETTEPKGDTETTEPKGDTDATEPVGDTDATEPDDTDETDSDAPVGPEIPDADSALSIKQAIEIGLSMGHNKYTEGKYYVTGTISAVTNTTYGNMVLVDNFGNELVIYGTWSADGETRYDALDVQPDEADVITVYGIVGQYNGKAQIKNGWIVVHTPVEPDAPATTESEAPETTESEAPETTESEAPETTESKAPETTESEAPETTESEAPETTESEAPETTETEAPETTESEAPETTESEAPETTESEAPETTESEAPVTTETEAPETTETETDTECAHEWGDYTPIEGDVTHTRQCIHCYEYEEPIVCPFTGIYTYDETHHWYECVCGRKFNVAEHDPDGYQANAEGHWEPCECGAKLNESEHDHTVAWESDSDEHWKTCVCSWTLDSGAHTPETVPTEDGTQHFTRCSDCQKQLSDPEAHSFMTDEAGVSHKCVCGATEACHASDVAYDANGHWTIGCDVCEIEKGTSAPHSENPVLVTETNGTTYTYTYKCAECDHVFETRTVDVSAAGINWISLPSNRFAANIHHAGGYLTGSAQGNAAGAEFGNIGYDKATGTVYTRVTFNEGGQAEFLNSFINAKANGKTPSQTVYGSGNFLVVKMRTSSQTSTVKFAIVGEDQTYDGWMHTPNTRATFAEGFVVYVIDLSMFDTAGRYTINNSSMTKAMYSIAGNANEYVDIAYFAVCDTWEEVDSIVTEEKVVVAKWSSAESDVLRKADGTCLGDGYHVNEYVKGENGLVEYKCSVCGTVEKTFTVGADGINTITLPSVSFACNNYNANGMNTDFSVFGNVNYDAVDGVQYTRVTLAVSGSFEFINGSASPDGKNKTLTQAVYGSGKYMVIKMRVGSGESMLKFGIFDTTDKYQKREHDSRFSQNVRNTFADGWAVYVIDLSKYDRTFWNNQAYSYADSSIAKAYYGMYGDDDGGDNDYVDIAYFAVCDSWAEIKSVVTDEQIIFTSWSDNNVTKTNLADYDDTVVEPEDTTETTKAETTESTEPETTEPETTEPVECSHKYAYVAIDTDGFAAYADTCSECGNVRNTVKVSADDVNWFSVGSRMSAGNRNNVNNLGTQYKWAGTDSYDENAGLKYMHMTFQDNGQGTNGDFEFTTGKDNYNRNGTLTQTIFGSGNYVVIKMRTSENLSSLEIAMVDGKHSNADFTGNKNWMYLANCRTTFADGWAVYVIDLSQYNMCSAYAANDDTLAKAFFGMRGESGEYVDIAYFAVCDDWAEVKSVVTDEQIILTNWVDNNITKTNLADYND